MPSHTLATTPAAHGRAPHEHPYRLIPGSERTR